MMAPPARRKDVIRGADGGGPPRRRVSWDAEPSPDVVGVLRGELREVFAGWGVSGEPAEVALLVANELISNAVEHARTPFRLTAHFTGSLLRLRVRDFSRQRPRLQPQDMHAERGRGLQLIDQLAARWSWTTHTDGKTVWAAVTPS